MIDPEDAPILEEGISEVDPEGLRDALRRSEDLFVNRTRREFSDETELPRGVVSDPVAESPFTTVIEGKDREAVERVHESFSEATQGLDESFNAPTTVDVGKWAENPDRLDYPGVDTIPKEEQRRRGEALADFATEEGIVANISFPSVIDSLAGVGKTMGIATERRGDRGSDVAVRESVRDEEEPDPRFAFGPVLAHEVGHAIDFGSGRRINRILHGNQELREEATEVSRTVRGPFEDASEARINYRAEGVTGRQELAADFVMSRTIQPRATERIAPELTEEFDEEFKEEFGIEFDKAVSPDS